MVTESANRQSSDTGGTSDGARGSRQDAAYRELQSRHDRLDTRLKQVEPALQQMQGLSQQLQQAQQQLANYELERRTAGLPEDQRQAAIYQAQIQAAQYAVQQERAAIAQERAQRGQLDNYVGRKDFATDLIFELELPHKLPTPEGERSTLQYLITHADAKDPDSMRTLAQGIKGKLDKEAPATATRRRATEPQRSKFLSGSGGNTPGKATGLINNLANRNKQAEYMKKGYSYSELKAKGMVVTGAAVD